jgi:hypothetical protein
LTVRLTIGQAASYLKFGRIFIATETGANCGTCYGSDPFYYYTNPLPKCTVYAGVLCIGQKADLVHMWVDGNKLTIFPGSTRNGVTSNTHPKTANGYTFLTVNTTVYGAGYADFKTNACPYGFHKSASGNGGCSSWTTGAGCRVGQGFIPGNITHDAHCYACPAGMYSDTYDFKDCQLYTGFTNISGSVTTYESSVGEIVDLSCAPGYTRNSSVMLWCTHPGCSANCSSLRHRVCSLNRG